VRRSSDAPSPPLREKAFEKFAESECIIMSVEISGKYLGDLKVEVVHGPSGTSLRTAAPVDNNGDGSSFSPTDLVGAALGACMLTVMGIVAERDGISLAAASFRAEKHMSASPRRIGAIPITFTLPASLTAEQRTKLERAALTCPVHHSLHPDIQVEVTFEYAGAATP
jgi:putative redox protein